MMDFEEKASFTRYDCLYSSYENAMTMQRMPDGDYIKYSHAIAKIEKLEAAVEASRKAFDEMFSHCCSNGVYNRWGKGMNCTSINEAILLIDRLEK